MCGARCSQRERQPVSTFGFSARGWGYNPVAMYAVMDAFGGYTALKRFVNSCHTRNLAVVMDVVVNHMQPHINILHQYDGFK